MPLPAAIGVPLSRWTGPELAAELAARGLAGPISVSSLRPGDRLLPTTTSPPSKPRDGSSSR